MAQARSCPSRDLLISAVGAELNGTLTLPEFASAVVIFVHGSGSSRFSPRNRYVAEVLHRAGLATLLFDLLTPEEEVRDQRSGALRFDIELLSKRMVATVDWVRQQPDLHGLLLGLFGASTGAAAALNTAAARPELIRSVVSRGGRPDLAQSALAQVQAPTLLLVGGDDTVVIELNRQAAQSLSARHELVIVPGASHLFEEPGKLETVAGLARDWLLKELR
ncbi:dienelactone hydrolase family protein [Marinobacter sp. SS21]|uniref:dienelactone hydrolase family protein n=1 Tax=Marinobacter sp. SS21 TaxID=2979460 RepID=UPI00232E4045|nr:alpha/beta family hydrolase [Marinobacter sp. SS21]MDC0663767.1 dienelactone hydrolase family protein [Marinobacter sp. SS21]